MIADIRVFGDEQTSARFRAMARRAENTGPFFNAAARLLMRAVRDRFNAAPWSPLDADTIRRKARTGQDPRTLRASGTLERALTVWGAPGQRLDITPEQLTFGLVPNGTAFYGRFHQAGASVPRRIMLTLPHSIERRIRDVWRNHLLGRRI